MFDKAALDALLEECHKRQGPPRRGGKPGVAGLDQATAGPRAGLGCMGHHRRGGPGACGIPSRAGPVLPSPVAA